MRRTGAKIEADELRRLLKYDPETGKFERLVSLGFNSKVGPVKEHRHPYGYLSLIVRGKQYLSHRLAWLYMTGAWPIYQIDHINGVFDDNRWVNLRDITHSQNLQNVGGAAAHNRLTGLLGVKVDRRRGTFVGRINLNKKTYSTKPFKTAEEAKAARDELAKTLHPFFNPDREVQNEQV